MRNPTQTQGNTIATNAIPRRVARGLALAIGILPLAAPAAAWAVLPLISGVSLSKAADGSYTAAITGRHLGAAPAGIPCTACTLGVLNVAALATRPTPQAVNVLSWNASAVTISGIRVDQGDTLRIGIFNPALQASAAWAGAVGKLAKTTPRITGVAFTGTGPTLQITVTGRGFGPPIAAVGSTTNSPFLVVSSFNAAAPYIDGWPWNAGFCGAGECDGVTVNYVSWSDTQIVLGGFGSSYGNNWQVGSGDPVCIGVWPSTSTSNGTTGGRMVCRRLH